MRTVGTRSNRDGIGAVVRVASASGPQWNTVRSGSSYCSQSELIQTFGLGRDAEVTELEVDWPGGAKQKLGRVAADQTVTVEEGKGIVAHEGPGR